MNTEWKRDFIREGKPKVTSEGEWYIFVRARDRNYRGFFDIIYTDDLDYEIPKLYEKFEAFKKSVIELMHQPQRLNPPKEAIVY